MNALDTNVLARYLLADEPKQAAAVRALIDDIEGEFWIPITVVLELAWVLHGKRVPDGEIAVRLRQLFSLRSLRLQLPGPVFQALRWAEQGMDMADALHLALSDKAACFLTFDAALVRSAVKLGALPPVSAP